MPTRARSFGRSVRGSPTLIPSTVIFPFSKGSSALTHLISVDFPDPDGPHTTTTSPLATFVVQSFSAWNVVPYHLSTWLISIIDGPLPNDGNARLQLADAKGRDTGNHEIDDSREQIHLDQPTVALRDLAGGAEEIGNRQHIDQRGVLKQYDRLRQQHRKHVAECLRQHDVTHGLSVSEAERGSRRRLAPRNRLDAGAHDLREICRLEQREGKKGRREGADAHRPR